ncbi:hypothetical protein M1L60_43585 [Actinoplanes sp. TRM 88003]|uniref:Uncharacterized protein n=1 Tax=Paractinoplanes aksuensis TaxID=2939490 RepID=A0ABT1E2Y2_9ACTN|nr:hypothetical protein [Actinoplanes aksuensis]MCO8277484.1 hypothetical protein [Actinoplanes aksuensis]
MLALVWANLPGGSYEAVWRADFTVGVVLGLLTPTFRARTADLDRLERILQRFRREPGPEAARTLSIAAQGAVSSSRTRTCFSTTPGTFPAEVAR